MDIIEIGDLVLHKPTGERWAIIRTGTDPDGLYVEPAGWPKTRARAKDCRVLQKGAYSHWEEFKRAKAEQTGAKT